MISASEARELAPIKENTARFLWKKIEDHILSAASKQSCVAIPLTEYEYQRLSGRGEYEYHYEILISLWDLGYKTKVERLTINYLFISWEEN